MTTPPLDIRYVPHVLPDADADLAFLLTDVAWDDGRRARQTARGSTVTVAGRR